MKFDEKLADASYAAGVEDERMRIIELLETEADLRAGVSVADAEVLRDAARLIRER